MIYELIKKKNVIKHEAKFPKFLICLTIGYKLKYIVKFELNKSIIKTLFYWSKNIWNTKMNIQLKLPKCSLKYYVEIIK